MPSWGPGSLETLGSEFKVRGEMAVGHQKAAEEEGLLACTGLSASSLTGRGEAWISAQPRDWEAEGSSRATVQMY